MYIGFLLVSIWILIGNSWHALLIARRKGPGRPLTISEHAVESPQLLLVHRVVHSLPIVLFMPLIIGYLLPEGHVLAASLLFSAVVFDSIETLSLNKKTARLEDKLNIHSITAWLMAASYMLYSTVISQVAGISWLIYGPILAACIFLMMCAVTGAFKKHFLSMQMSFFLLISLMGLVAHVTLIAR